MTSTKTQKITFRSYAGKNEFTLEFLSKKKIIEKIFKDSFFKNGDFLKKVFLRWIIFKVLRLGFEKFKFYFVAEFM